jgi:hypothetical protein
MNKIIIRNNKIDKERFLKGNNSVENEALNFLFSDTTWNYDTSFLSFVTPYYVSTKLVQKVYEKYKLDENDYLWDMFGGIGMDSLSFNVYYNTVITELNKQTFLNLKSNIERHKTNKYQLKHFNMDNLVFYKRLKNKELNYNVNLIYFDPPWGNYYNSKRNFDFKYVRLSNGENVVELFFKLYTNITKNIILKCPYKCFTYENLFKLTTDNIIYFPQYKLKFIFIDESIKLKTSN